MVGIRIRVLAALLTPGKFSAIEWSFCCWLSLLPRSSFPSISSHLSPSHLLPLAQSMYLTLSHLGCQFFKTSDLCRSLVLPWSSCCLLYPSFFTFSPLCVRVLSFGFVFLGWRNGILSNLQRLLISGSFGIWMRAHPGEPVPYCSTELLSSIHCEPWAFSLKFLCPDICIKKALQLEGRTFHWT